MTKLNDPDLNRYISEIYEYPKYERDKEMELAAQIAKGDSKALQDLVKANLRYVVVIAKKYLGSGFSLSDLINEGTIGLIEAGKRFKPEKGVKFITYAVWWIRQAILYAIASKSSLIKLPPKQANLLHMVNRRIQSMTQKLGREPDVSELAEELNISADDIIAVTHSAKMLLSVDSPADETDEADHYVSLADDRSKMADDLVIEDSFVDDVDLLLACLDDREKEILKLHYGFNGTPSTLQEIGDRFGLTRERIRQIEQKAIKKLKRLAIRRNLQDYLR